MKYLKKNAFWSKLKRKYPANDMGWFCNSLLDAFPPPGVEISARAKIDTLITRTQVVPIVLNANFPLIAFPNGIAGWKNVTSNRKFSPVEILDPSELAQLIQRKMYFRDAKGFEDDYYITNGKLNWFVVFRHHGDWRFFGSQAATRKLKRQW